MPVDGLRIHDEEVRWDRAVQSMKKHAIYSLEEEPSEGALPVASAVQALRGDATCQSTGPPAAPEKATL